MFEYCANHDCVNYLPDANRRRQSPEKKNQPKAIKKHPRVPRWMSSGLKKPNNKPVKNGPAAAPMSRQVWFLVREDILCFG